MAGKLSKIINYRKINESNKEFRRSDYWIIEIEAPKGIYFPGNEILQIRTTTFDPGINDNPTVLEKKIRTFTVNQGAKAEATNGVIQITLADRVDQSISYFIDNWKLALGQRDELSGLAKELYVSPKITATYFNINEVPIRRLEFLNCMISDSTLPEQGADAPQLEEDIPLSIAYEHFHRIFDNTRL